MPLAPPHAHAVPTPCSPPPAPHTGSLAPRAYHSHPGAPNQLCRRGAPAARPGAGAPAPRGRAAGHAHARGGRGPRASRRTRRCPWAGNRERSLTAPTAAPVPHYLCRPSRAAPAPPCSRCRCAVPWSRPGRRPGPDQPGLLQRHAPHPGSPTRAKLEAPPRRASALHTRPRRCNVRNLRLRARVCRCAAHHPVVPPRFRGQTCGAGGDQQAGGEAGRVCGCCLVRPPRHESGVRVESGWGVGRGG